MIHLLFLLSLAIISSQNALPQNDKIVVEDLIGALRKTDEDAHDALQLVLDAFSRMRNYDCAINAGDCRSWQANTVGHDLILSNVDCDENPEAEICKNAIEFLNLEQGSSHEDILDELFNALEEIPDYGYINKVRDAVTDYTCYKQPSTCEIFR